MAGEYTISFGRVAVTAQQDLFEISPADDKPVEIVGLFLSQSSDAGDAQDEQLAFAIIRGHTTSGSGGSAATPRPVKRATAAAGCAAEVNNTTIASTGTAVTLFEDSFNVRAGYQMMFPDGFEFDAGQGDTTIVVRLLTTPADSLTMSGTLLVRERG